MARCEPETLRFEVGTQDWFTSYLSHSFAGIEADGLRVVTLDVANTFHGQFSLRATRYHLHPYKRSSRPFAGKVRADHYGSKVRVVVTLDCYGAARQARTNQSLNFSWRHACFLSLSVRSGGPL